MNHTDKLENIDRRTALKKLKGSGKTFASIGLGLSFIGLSARNAFAQFEDLEIGRALNFILQIEFMQEAFYVQTTTQNGLLPPPYQSIFSEIRGQHQGRVVLIKNLIASLEISPAPQLRFNFRFNDEINPFLSFDQFLNVAQVIEDTAAGVYKKQITNVVQNNPTDGIVRTLMRLHSTESRHAYFIRQLRAERGLDDIKGWIDQADLGTLSPAFENIYAGEGTTIQEGIHIPSITKSSAQAVQEAWDEPIGRGPAGSILQLFTNPL